MDTIKTTEHAKESKTVQRLRRKLKRKMREESKIMKKRLMMKIDQLIRPQFASKMTSSRQEVKGKESVKKTRARKTVLKGKTNDATSLVAHHLIEGDIFSKGSARQ